MRFTVYKTTNTLNGKSYIGVHRTEDPNDSYLGSGNLIGKAIKKYGRDAFEKEVLFDFDTPEEMFAKERELVNDAFRKRADTYNLAKGGKNPFKGYASEKMAEWGRMGAKAQADRAAKDPVFRRHLQEQWGRARAKARETHTLEPFDWTGRTHSEETKAKMSEAALGRTGEQSSGFGTCWICKPGDKLRKVQKAELARWLDQGWQRGRVIRKPKPPRTYPKGEQMGSSKLTWEEVREIRRLYPEGGHTHVSLALQFNTSASNITNILNHKVWRE